MWIDQDRTLRGVEHFGRYAAEPDALHRAESAAAHGHERLLRCIFLGGF